MVLTSLIKKRILFFPGVNVYYICGLQGGHGLLKISFTHIEHALTSVAHRCGKTLPYSASHSGRLGPPYQDNF